MATAYRGVTRATAIGIVYAVYGAATAASPALLTILGPTGPTWPAFVACVAGASIALWVAWRRTPDLPAIARHERDYVASTALWAMAIVDPDRGPHGPRQPPRRSAPDRADRRRPRDGDRLPAVGPADPRRERRPSPCTSSRRPVTVAVAVGVIVGFAQAAPLFQLPLFFNLVLRYGPFGATLATAPFIVALIVAGPIAGSLLARFRPRTLVAGGLAAVGLGNIAAGAVLGQQVSYLAFVLPMAGIGAGFVVATTVRTAIIFASVSRGLPGTAAALNEASLLVGSRIGLTALTAIITERALSLYSSSLGAVAPAARDTAVAAFRDLLVAIGTPGLAHLAGTISPGRPGGLCGVDRGRVSRESPGDGPDRADRAPIVWLALGARDPLTTVWDHLDERNETAGTAAGLSSERPSRLGRRSPSRLARPHDAPGLRRLGVLELGRLGREGRRPPAIPCREGTGRQPVQDDRQQHRPHDRRDQRPRIHAGLREGRRARG